MDYYQNQQPQGKVMSTSPLATVPDQEGFLDHSLRMVLQHANEMITIHQPDGTIKFASPGCNKLLGNSIEDLLGEDIRTWVHPEDLDDLKFPDPDLVNGPLSYDMRYRVMKENGDYIWVESSCATLHDEKTGDLLEVILATKDINEYMLLVQHQENDDKSAEKDFIRFVSHDLKEPVRGISHFTSLLAKQYGKDIPKKGRGYLDFLTSQALRLNDLIEGMTELSLLQKAPQRFDKIDLNQVIGRTLDHLRLTIEESNAKVNVQQLPVIMGEEVLVERLFQNLIGNSLRYKGEAAPYIEIGFVEKDGQWVFMVKDNGVGFKSKYAEEIFIMFRRTHSNSEFPGNGIGLAICKKIVEQHGGTIWAEGAEGEGASFYFTLPPYAGAAEIQA